MPPEEDRATATGDLHNKFREDRSSGSKDMLADRQTDRRVDHNRPYSAPLPGRSNNNTKIYNAHIIKHYAWIGGAEIARSAAYYKTTLRAWHCICGAWTIVTLALPNPHPSLPHHKWCARTYAATRHPWRIDWPAATALQKRQSTWQTFQF